MAAGIELFDSFIIELLGLFLELFLVVGLDLVVQIADVHFLHGLLLLEVLAEIGADLGFSDFEVLVLKLFPIGGSLLVGLLDIVDELIFFLHLFVSIGLLLLIAHLLINQKLLITANG